MRRLITVGVMLWLLALVLPQTAAAQSPPAAQCVGVGGWPTIADLTTNKPANSYICANAWTYDTGFVVSNGTVWQPPPAVTAATATSLAATPAQCSSGYSKGVAANGNANCSNIIAADLPPTITANTTGNAATATVATSANSATSAGTAAALSSTPTQCSGQFATGITASGNANCASQVAPPVGSPTSRSLSLATAYQATTTTKAANVNINLTSTASISLSGGSTNTATVYIGSTNGVASGTGTAICLYSNSNTGTLTIGLNLSTVASVPCSFALPSGWFFAVLQSSGTVTISSAFDQAIG